MKIPRHLQNLITNLDRCRRCRHACSDADLSLIGVKEANAGRLHVIADIVCPRCGAVNRTADTTHDFAGTDWWKVIGQRHDAAIAEMGPYSPKNPAGRPQLFLSPRPTAEFYITAGIRSARSVCIVEYRTTSGTMGTCRLTRSKTAHLSNWNSRKFPTATDWLKISHNLEGSQFTLQGQVWRRMTRAEIQEVVRDQVFEVVESPKAKRKPHSVKRTE